MKVSDKLADLLRGDIQTAVEELLCVEPGCANTIAGHIFTCLQIKWGGQDIYIPAVDNGARNLAIKTMFTGRNHVEVCREHRISLRQLYRIIK